MKDRLPESARRLHLAVSKIPAEETGLNAAFYLHVDRSDRCPCCGGYRVAGVRFKTPGKFENKTIERLLDVLNARLAAELGGGDE